MHVPLVALVLLTGCAQKLPSLALPVFASYDAWCAQLKGAVCRGEWPDGKPGTAKLGAYRFVVIEAGSIDTFGGGPSLSFELHTARGFVYAPLGAIGSTGRTGVTTINVEGITEHPGALDLRTHARMTSSAGMTDTQEAILFSEGPAGVGIARVHLGSNTRDELGRAKGHFGELTWKDATILSHATRLKDGEYRLAAP